MFALSYAAAALVFLIGVAWGARSWVSSRNASRRNLDVALTETEAVAKRSKDLLTDDLIIADMLSPRVSPLDTLLELTKQNPDRKKVAFTDFTLDREKIKLNVEASSDADASNVVSFLSKSKLFTEVKTGQFTTIERQKKPLVQFQITCKLAERAIDAVVTQKQSKTPSGGLAHKPPEETFEPPAEKEKVAAQHQQEDTKKPGEADEGSPEPKIMEKKKLDDKKKDALKKALMERMKGKSAK